MTGGYIDTNRRKSRLELRSTVRDLVARRAEMQQKEQELRTRLNQVDGEINKFEQELGRLDVETQQAKYVTSFRRARFFVFRSEFAMMTDKRRVNNERLHLIQQNKRGRDANLLQVTGFIRQLQAKREDKKAELGAELGSQLTADEQVIIAVAEA
jgi:predicted nuclease with TOPRIM domain